MIDDDIRDDDTRDDDTLMDELREALLSRDAVTQRSRAAARAAYAWRTIDAELLQVAHDSLAGAEALVRGPADVSEARLVSFEGADVSVEIELVADQLIGQVIPGQEGTISLQSPKADERTAVTDEAGFFEFHDPPPPPLRLRLVLAGRVMTTAWLADNG